MNVKIEVYYKGDRFTLERDLKNNVWRLDSDDVTREIALQGLQSMARDMHREIYGDNDYE